MTWGIDFRRSERPHREFTSWSNKDGGTLDSSFYGVLSGLAGVASPYALEVRPYFLTMHVRETVDEGDGPYDDEFERYAFEFLYSWEYRPGSWFYVVYNQVLEGESGSVDALEPISGIKISYLMRF